MRKLWVLEVNRWDDTNDYEVFESKAELLARIEEYNDRYGHYTLYNSWDRLSTYKAKERKL